MSIREIAQEETVAREKLKLMTTEYTVEESGHIRDEPIVHLICRREDGSRRHIEVEGFYPYFYISLDEFEENKNELLNEDRIRRIEVPENYTEDDKDLRFVDHVKEFDNNVNTLRGQSLVKLVVGIPKHVSNRDDSGLADYFDKTWEADVFFTQRFLISQGIGTGLTAPADEDRVHVSELEPLDSEESPDVLPRTIYLDIEVYNEGEFPDPTDADRPVTSISAYDNYDDEYKAWILHHDDWDIPGAECESEDDIEKMEDFFEEQYDERWPGTDVRVFIDEAHLLDDFHDYVVDRRPDILTGWNSSKNDIGNGFDLPYLISRSKNVNAWNIKEWTPLNEGNVFTTRAGSPVVEGVELLDMLAAYEKTQIHELRQKSLEYVAQQEIGMGKEEIDDIGQAWIEEPVDFLMYNIRDTEAVVEIDHSQDDVDEEEDREPEHGILKMFNHLRDVTGQLYTECLHNISMIDMLFLRDAFEKNIALPTSEKPDVRHYHGAKVFTPTPGLSQNVFYPDLASLYPNLFWATNMSPETVIGNHEELEASGYSEEDCFVVYWDPRDEEVKKDDDAPDYDPDEHDEALYVLKPDVKKGFVRDSIGDLIDMKYEYKGTEKYGAVKRVTNSVYGVMGDSDTYGKGFRLFDVQIAEAITLAGRKVLEFTAKCIRNYFHDNGYEGAEIVGGDTDSAMVSVPSYNLDPEKLQEDVERIENGGEPETEPFKAAEYTNGQYDGFMAETFNISVEEGYEHKMEVEVESAADALFFKSDYDADNPREVGKKKRYSQTIVWDENDGVIRDPEAEHTGWDLVRSDSSALTVWAQDEVLSRLLLAEEPKSEVFDFLEKAVEHLENGDLEALSEMAGQEFTMEDVGIPKSISSAPPEEYGVDDETGENTRTPHPHIRGAKYATQNIDGEDITQGAKPYLYHVKRVGGDYPQAYSADTLEDGDVVDAIAVENPENIPDEIGVDWGTMTEKLLRKPIEEILMTMDWTWEDVTSEGRQAGLGAWT